MVYTVTFASGRFVEIYAEGLDEAYSAAGDAYLDEYGAAPAGDEILTVISD